jgi:hypothetical protein
VKEKNLHIFQPPHARLSFNPVQSALVQYQRKLYGFDVQLSSEFTHTPRVSGDRMRWLMIGAAWGRSLNIKQEQMINSAVDMHVVEYASLLK